MFYASYIDGFSLNDKWEKGRLEESTREQYHCTIHTSSSSTEVEAAAKPWPVVNRFLLESSSSTNFLLGGRSSWKGGIREAQ